MEINIRGLRWSDAQLKESVVELSRLTYKNSGVSLYMPKGIVNALHLNPDIDRSLVTFSIGDSGLYLIKDTELVKRLKPMILDLRSRLVGINSSSKFLVNHTF